MIEPLRPTCVTTHHHVSAKWLLTSVGYQQPLPSHRDSPGGTVVMRASRVFHYSVNMYKKQCVTEGGHQSRTGSPTPNIGAESLSRSSPHSCPLAALLNWVLSEYKVTCNNIFYSLTKNPAVTYLLFGIVARGRVDRFKIS